MTDGNLPGHVAFIMDGNGRWAEGRGLPRALGHRAGAETVRRVTAHALKRGIPHLTLYAFSTENWSRPRDEVEALMRLLGDFLDAETPGMVKNGIRLNAIGNLAALSMTLTEKLDRARAATAGCRRLVLTLAINYGGRDEIVRAARKAQAKIAVCGREPGSLDEDLLASCLDTAGIPEPDLIVRTAGEMRISNFLVWQAAYAELHFTRRTWPDFSDQDFDDALAAYAGRVRKFGGAGDRGNGTSHASD